MTASGSNSRLPRASELDVALWSTVSDLLLEKVVARLPVYSLFRASTLSREWWRRFSSASFQREVNCSSSVSGTPFCSLFKTYENELVGFETSSREWCRLPTFSYLPFNNWHLIAASGSLLCLTRTIPNEYVVVTNPLTRTWRVLPPRPQRPLFYSGGREVNFKIRQVQIACEGGSTTYRVFLNTRYSSSFYDMWILWIFDSADGSWGNSELTFSPSAEFPSSTEFSMTWSLWVVVRENKRVTVPSPTEFFRKSLWEVGDHVAP